MNPIRSLSAIPTRALLASFLLCFALGWATAQEAADLLADYESASTALNESLEAFAADQVESLDALRRARDAFAPLAAELTPPLRRGLTTTFASAEGAIGNRSETDLRVQAAVLRGGFQRALYESALETASADLPRAQELLGVLATDLGMTQTVFSNASPRALQTAFEEQLAALSLAQLGTGDDRESRYEALATVYGHVFLVQDSPRLPAETQATLLSAIQALVTDEPLAPTLETLRAQLTKFGQAAQTAGAPEGVAPAGAEANPGAAAAEDTVTGDGIADGDAAGDGVAGAADGTLAGKAATGVAGTGAEESAETGAEASTEELAEIDIAPALTPDVQAADIDAAAAAAETDNPAGEGDGAVGTPATTNPPAAPVNTTPNAAPNTPGTPLSPNDQLLSDLRNPLLLIAGALALIGFLGLLFSRRSPVPWRDTALALLLLPVIGEGIIALAPTVSPYLTPYTERYVAPLYRTYVAPTLEPYLTLPSGDLAAYSLFTNPYTQVVWLGLVILSSLCLLLGLRSSSSDKVSSEAVRSRPTQIADTTANTTVVVTPATPTTSVATSAHSDGGGRTPQTGQLSTGSGFNWDEDF